MRDFVYNIPTKIYFGKNTEEKIGFLISEFKPHKVLIHYGQNSVIKSGLLEKVETLLKTENISFIELGGVQPNPTLTLVRKGIELGIKNKVDFILAIGGGSVMDSAKDIANGIANHDDDVWDYSLYNKAPNKTIHKAAIVTLAASGSEMSDSCVITNEQTHQKKGYCSTFNRFDFAIENPELTYTVSKYQTACGAVDIAMHTIERYFDLGDDAYVTDEIALGVIKSAFKSGKDAYDNPNNYIARANMLWASSVAHNGLTHLGKDFLLTVHQLEHPLSALYPNIAHGAGLAALWCSWARYVYKSNIPRWTNYSKAIWNKTNILKAIDKQEQYYKSIGMPTSLRELNVQIEDLETLANMVTNNKTKEIRGFKTLNYNDVLEIYKMSY